MSNSKDPLPKLRSGPGTPLEARAGRLLEAADPIEPWPAGQRQESWRRIAARVDEPPQHGARWLGVAVAAMGLMAALLVGRQLLVKPEPAAPLVAAVVAPPRNSTSRPPS